MFSLFEIAGILQASSIVQSDHRTFNVKKKNWESEYLLRTDKSNMFLVPSMLQRNSQHN